MAKEQSNRKMEAVGWPVAGFLLGFVIGYLALDSVALGIILGFGLSGIGGIYASKK